MSLAGTISYQLQTKFLILLRRPHPQTKCAQIKLPLLLLAKRPTCLTVITTGPHETHFFSPYEPSCISDSPRPTLPSRERGSLVPGGRIRWLHLRRWRSNEIPRRGLLGTTVSLTVDGTAARVDIDAYFLLRAGAYLSTCELAHALNELYLALAYVSA